MEEDDVGTHAAVKDKLLLAILDPPPEKVVRVQQCFFTFQTISPIGVSNFLKGAVIKTRSWLAYIDLYSYYSAIMIKPYKDSCISL